MRTLPLICLLLLAAPLPASPATPPELSFEAGAVLARGVTPKGRIVWFSVAREISRQSATIVPRIEQKADEDGDGVVRLELDQELPLRSIWFAVDLETGESAVAAPEGFPLLEGGLAGKAIPAALNRLDLQSGFVYLVLVRPGVGAWRLRAGDGGASDEDGQPDGTLRAALASLEGIDPSTPPPPERFSPSDLLLVIDPNRMEYLRFRAGGDR